MHTGANDRILAAIEALDDDLQILGLAPAGHPLSLPGGITRS